MPPPADFTSQSFPPPPPGQKTKLLLSGPLLSTSSFSSLKLLAKKVKTLHEGSAGPFDCVIVAGAMFGGVGGDDDDGDCDGNDGEEGGTDSLLPEFVIPLYFYDIGKSIITNSGKIEKRINDISNALSATTPNTEPPPPPVDTCIQPKSNIHYIGPSGLSTLHNLVICWSRSRVTAPSLIHSAASQPAFLGCDLLLSSTFPQGSLSILPPGTRNMLQTINGESIDAETFGDGDVADLAVIVRPRYHIVGGGTVNDAHLLGLPYENSDPINSHKKYHVTRLISLASVTGSASNKATTVAVENMLKEGVVGVSKKTTKFIHAIGIQSLTRMKSEEVNSVPKGTVKCPYVDTATLPVSGTNGNSGSSNSGGAGGKGMYGISDTRARELAGGGEGGQFRWAGRGIDNNAGNSRKRGRSDDTRGGGIYGPGGADDGSTRVDPNCKTLFVSGLNRDPGGIVTVSSLGSAFKVYNPTRVNIPPGKMYAFVEFATHEEANNCLVNCSGGIDVLGVWLTLNWGKSNSNANGNGSGDGGGEREAKRQRQVRPTVRESDCPDSSCLFFSFPKQIPDSDLVTTSETLRLLCEHVLEDAINSDGTPEGGRITALDEPALKVECRLGGNSQGYGFLGFASHAAAQMTIATLTTCTDGGELSSALISGIDKLQEAEKLGGTVVFWSKNTFAAMRKEGEDTKGLNFSRVRYPPDSRSECWFCLASPTCEKHLLVSIGTQVYVAMPKGPLVPDHSLIIPVVHSGSGALLGSSNDEVNQYKDKLRRHAKQQGKELFVWERAIETKGGLHSHVQCVPIPREKARGISSLVDKAGGRLGLGLKEIRNDVSLKAILDGEGKGGYFYLEIPDGAGGVKKMVSSYEPGDEGGRKPGMQLGREIAAMALDMPERAHWKGCVESEEKEKTVTMSFRESFGKSEKEGE